MKLYNIARLRKIVLPVLQKTAFDFRIRHPWNPNVTVLVNSFMHKGYWWHRRNREVKTMRLFARMIEKGDYVFEVGGHIGFITTYFASLAEDTGHVNVFEPGENNLPYMKCNISLTHAGNLSGYITLVEAAVSDHDGEAELYEDSLTGQNNSLVRDFEKLKRNQEYAFVVSGVVKRKVVVLTLDKYAGASSEGRCDFVKIDIEGHEWAAIQGASRLISQLQPKIMIEIQASELDIFEFLTQAGYVLFNDDLLIKESSDELKGNTFCLHEVKHAKLIRSLGLNR